MTTPIGMWVGVGDGADGGWSRAGAIVSLTTATDTVNFNGPTITATGNPTWDTGTGTFTVNGNATFHGTLSVHGASVTAASNPTWDFGTSLATFGGSVAFGAAVTATGTVRFGTAGTLKFLDGVTDRRLVEWTAVPNLYYGDLGVNSTSVYSGGAIYLIGSGGTVTLGAGSCAFPQQVVLPSHAKGALPAGVTGGMIYVTDEAGGAVPAFYDGANWRRVTDRAIVS